MVRVGIIGCGKVSQIRHLPELAKNDDVQISGVYDLNLDRAIDIATQYSCAVFDSWHQIITSKEIDAVIVATSNDTHAEISIAALNQGKHVLCEKPMATTLEDCVKMVEVAEATGKILMIGQNQRLNEAHVKAKELLQIGAIGKPLTFQTNFGHSGADNWSVDGKNSWFFNKQSAGFGVLGDLGIHKTDLIHYLFSDQICEVTAFIDTLDKKTTSGEKIALDDNAICIYKLQSGIVGTMTVSWTRYGQEDNSTTIYGTEGIMYIYKNAEHPLIVEDEKGRQVYYDIGSIQTNKNQTDSGVSRLFVSGILNNTPQISAKEVLPAMRAVFAARESSIKGCKVFC